MKATTAKTTGDTLKGDTLTGQQARALAALIAGQSVENSAKVAKVGATTLHRWLKEPNFAGAYRDARRNLVEQASATMQRAAHASARTIIGIMVDVSLPAGVRLRAAIAIQDAAMRWAENDDLGARIAALEALARCQEGFKP